MKRVKLSKEPTLHVHRYVVCISRFRAVKNAKGKTTGKRCWHTEYRYPINRIELRRYLCEAPKGTYIEVFEAHHNFREAWDKGCFESPKGKK